MQNKRKEEKLQLKRQEELEAKKKRELDIKMSIKKTLNHMKTSSSKLETYKKEYIEKARNAALINNKQGYNLSKQALKLCLSKQKYIDSMMLNFDILLSMNDMNKVINEFVDGINTISNDMSSITSGIDISKAQLAFEKAMANSENQYEALDLFLKESEQNIESFNGNENDIDEDEIDKLINCQAADSEADDEIDSKIDIIRQKLNG